MISIEEAIGLIQNNIPERLVVTRTLIDAAGLFLAEDVVAPEPSPRYTNSAMDGYAIQWCSLESAHPDTLYKIIGESQAGKNFSGELKDGQVIRINTGAAVPESADTVIRMEDTEENGSHVKITQIPKKQGQDIRYKGEEFEEGSVLLEKGTRVQAPHIALLTAVGIETISVYKPCEITLLITGSELVAAGNKIGTYQIRDSNMTMLVAAIQEAGGVVKQTVRVPDDEDITRQAISDSKTDLIVCTGGVSVGDHDHVKSAAEYNGFKQIFWRIKQKPGKPLFFAKKNRKLLFGLPGNPVSAFMCFTHYLRPLINSINGQTFGWPIVAGEALADITNSGKRTNLIRVQLTWRPNGGYCITDAIAQGSHMLTSLSDSDGYIILEPDQTLRQGEFTDVYCYNSMRDSI